jgi:hypothetical protein
MKPVDFESFVDELATLSGRAILPFFRTAMLPEDKSRGGVFDPVTEADRAGEAAQQAAGLPGPYRLAQGFCGQRTKKPSAHTMSWS